MFIIQINNYTENKNTPIITYGDTIYDNYDAAKTDINNMVLDEMDNYKDEETTFDLIANDKFDARIVNSLGETDYEYIIMELVRKKPV